MMTDAANEIMNHFVEQGRVEQGSVLIISELYRKAREWGPQYVENLESAMRELQDEGYVLITAPHGLELTGRGVSYLSDEQ